VRVGFGQDPGQAGKSQAFHLVRALSSFTVTPASESGDKLTRFAPFSSQCRAGNLKIRRGSWNEELFRALEGFPELAHDDEVDACSGAREMLSPNMKDWAKSSGCAERRKSSTRRSNLSRPRPYTPAAPWSGRPSRRRKERPKSRLARSGEPVARL
jgi:Terminase RNaseH-like domain